MSKAFSWPLLALCLLSAGMSSRKEFTITQDKIAEALKEPLRTNGFPTRLSIAGENDPLPVNVAYTIDWKLQKEMENRFLQYRPDYGAFVALDASTGKILSLISFTKEPSHFGNLALKAHFPAASIFKIITAAAALDQKRITPQTVISFNGGNHTLYKRNVTSFALNRYSRHMTVSEAFAKSVNTVFAKLGLYFLHPEHLIDYAARFHFNRTLPTDVPVERAQFSVPLGDDWSLAEAASGFSQAATLSPVQAALIAATIANDGQMLEPHLVNEIETTDKISIYRAQPRVITEALSKESSQSLRQMMQETIRIGTSRKAFRDLLRRSKYQGVEIGGKTGSLSGDEPKGKYDWFIGYAVGSDDRKVAMAALTINGTKWRVKSSQLARFFVEKYF